MQVSKWGNSLAVRFPAGLVQALDLKEGEEIDLHLVGHRSFEVVKKPSVTELLARLHQFRGRYQQIFTLTGLKPMKETALCEQTLYRQQCRFVSFIWRCAKGRPGTSPVDSRGIHQRSSS